MTQNETEEMQRYVDRKFTEIKTLKLTKEIDRQFQKELRMK